MTKKWLSSRPDCCEVCEKSFTVGSSFIDGRTSTGPWALMCTECHKGFGGQLGIGYGQQYDWATCNLIKGDKTMANDDIDRDDPIYDEGEEDDQDDFEPEDD